MSEVESNEFELDEVTEEIGSPQDEPDVKDSRSKQKYEARRRIDDLLEEKRLRKLLKDEWDLDDQDED